MKWLVVVLALGASSTFAEDAPAGVPAEVWATYSEGKNAYDAKNFGRALEKFDACIAKEPQRPRWHYNRGLALKKLKRDDEARDALLKSRALDPAYKAKEISEKLGELGSAPAPARAPTGHEDPSGESNPLPFIVAGVLGLAVFWKWGLERLPPEKPQPPPPDLEALRARHDELATRLAQLERACAHTSDATLHAAIEDASDQLCDTRTLVMDRQTLPLPALLGSAQAAVERTELLFQNKLPGWRTLQGAAHPNCFFCARHLSTPGLKRAVAVVLDGQRSVVPCCARCAEICARVGDRPRMLTIGGAHWSTQPIFDRQKDGLKATPHGSMRNLHLVGLTPSSLAALAVGAGAAAAALTLVDLDAFKEAGVAAAASVAAAQSASRRNTASSSSRDHS